MTNDSISYKLDGWHWVWPSPRMLQVAVMVVYGQLRSQNYDCLKVLPKISPMSSVQHRRFEKRHFLKRLPSSLNRFRRWTFVFGRQSPAIAGETPETLIFHLLSVNQKRSIDSCRINPKAFASCRSTVVRSGKITVCFLIDLFNKN